MKPEVEVVVVGAGAVGLATAAALARAGREVVVLERHGQLAAETSSRNSGVVHAGLYYPPGSLKAELCVSGREQVYARCLEHGVPHRVLGKLVVATRPEELPALEALLARGLENGAPDLALLDAAQLRAREPAVRALAGLSSPRTGIVDAHALCLSWAAELESHGGVVLRHAELLGIEGKPPGFHLRLRDADGQLASTVCAGLVNAAGLASDRVAAMAGLPIDELGYRLHPCKGDYFAVAPGAGLALGGLVYPLPSGAGLGIHVSLDLGGRIRLGPDAEYVDGVDYRVDPAKAVRFAEAASRYLPGLRAEWLSPDGAGIRPRRAGPGDGFRDFVVAEESAHGAPGLVSLVGIESPGLTAAPAIGERVVRLLAGL